MKLGHFLTPHTKVNSKWINNLNVRPETIKILEESIGSNFSDTGHSNIFLELSPKGNKCKNKLLGHQNKKLPYNKENNQQHRKTTY